MDVSKQSGSRIVSMPKLVYAHESLSSRSACSGKLQTVRSNRARRNARKDCAGATPDIKRRPVSSVFNAGTGPSYLDQRTAIDCRRHTNQFCLTISATGRMTNNNESAGEDSKPVVVSVATFPHASR